MKLYYSPLACSLATRVTLSELGRVAEFIRVDPHTKVTEHGDDFYQVNSLGLVPTLVTDSGTILTENFAVLQHVAQGSSLAPDRERDELARWLGFIGTEIHKGIFAALFDATASSEVKAYAIKSAAPRLVYLNEYLDGRAFLLEGFTVADAYLITVLHWAQATPIDLTPWPAIVDYLKRGLARPSFKDAIAHELPLYLAEKRVES